MRPLRRLGRWLARCPRPKHPLAETLALLGIGLIAAGLYWLLPAAALLWLGAVAILAAVALAWPPPPRGPRGGAA